jgi:pimeloyl-ACP methyl ester carboxylesterase
MKKIALAIIAASFFTACASNLSETQSIAVPPTQSDTATPTRQPTLTFTPTVTETQAPSATPTEVLTPTPDTPTDVVRFITEDDFTIVGSVLGDGEIAVILTHMGEAGSASRKSWIPFARYAASQGDFTFLAIDFRGYGASHGARSLSNQKLDILAAVEFLKQRGYKQIVCMGASMGGNACAEAAILYPEFIGLAIIASNPRIDRDYSELQMPKLFVLEEGDPYNLTDSMESVFEMMPGPKEYHTFPEDVHGTRMFETESGDDFHQLLVNYLRSLSQ